MAKDKDEKRGRPPISQYRLEMIRCDKCDLIFESRKAKKKHISEEHRI